MIVSSKPSLLSAMVAFLVLASASPGLAVKGINPDGTLDKPTISKAYFEGEFWTVINALEAFRKANKTSTREDSIYTFKYLSVVYAAEPTTRAKAESYMYQLIRMMPTIDLLDLYISDNIQSIFVKVKSDFEKVESSKAATTQPTPQSAAQPAQVAAAPARAYPAAPAQPVPASSSQADKPKKKSSLKVWAPLALGGVGIATATFFLVASGDEASNAKTPRPVDVTMDWPKEGSR